MKNIEKCKLLIVGSANYGERVKTPYDYELEKIAEPIKDKIKFTGFIDNHDLVPGENEVYIQVIKNEEINTYTLLVNKKSSEAVVNYDYLLEPLEVEEELPEYVAPLIGGICFFIILCTFLLLFKKKKKHKKTN